MLVFSIPVFELILLNSKFRIRGAKIFKKVALLPKQYFCLDQAF